MSVFGSGEIGGRGTWIKSPSGSENRGTGALQRRPWDLATSSKKSPILERQQSQRMATDEYRSFSGSKYKPHSPPSSPPLTTEDDAWDSVNNNESYRQSSNKSPTQEQHRHHHPGEGITKCICNRSFTEISCVSCGMIFEGRVRTPCPRHPNTIHLMDMDRCPVCRATNLTEVELMGTTSPPPPPSKVGMMQQSRPH